MVEAIERIRLAVRGWVQTELMVVHCNCFVFEDVLNGNGGLPKHSRVKRIVRKGERERDVLTVNWLQDVKILTSDDRQHLKSHAVTHDWKVVSLVIRL